MGDLTDLALIEAGKYKLEISSFDLSEIVGDIAPSVNFVAQGKGVQLIDKAPRKGAEGLNIAFLHPKSTHGILLELCEKPE